MREVTVSLWCDRDWDRAREKVPGTTRSYDVGQGMREIELCDVCEASITLAALIALLEKLGRTPKAEKKPHRIRTVDGSFECRFCDVIFPNKLYRGRHEYAEHPAQRLQYDIDTNEYSRSRHRKRVGEIERQIEQRGLTLEEAVAQEKGAA